MSRIKGWKFAVVLVVIGGCTVTDVSKNNDYIIGKLVSKTGENTGGIDVRSMNGLVGEGVKAEPFDARYLADWYDLEWDKVTCKLSRLAESDNYFLTFTDANDQKTYFTASIVKIGDLKLLDMMENPSRDGTTREHLLFKIERRLYVGYGFGSDLKKRMEILGKGPKYTYKGLMLTPLRGRYFQDHPDQLASQPYPNQIARVQLFANPKELREFFAQHGDDKGLWADESAAIQLNAKLNPGDPQSLSEILKSESAK